MELDVHIGMAQQLALGGAVMLLTIVLLGAGFAALELWFLRSRAWLLRPPHAARLMTALGVFALWVLVEISAAVWIWAITFRLLGLFETMEPAVYFALVSFTTLGFGDILLPENWRLLSGLAATNGLMNFGLLTAAGVEALRQLRILQREGVE